MVRRDWRDWLAGFVAGLAVLGVACGGSNGQPAPPAASVTLDTRVPTMQPAEAAASATTVPEVELPAATSTAVPTPSSTPAEATDAARKTRYGDLRYTVTDVVVSNETPRTHGNPNSEQTGAESYVYVHLDITNQLRHVTITTGYELMQLGIGDERIEPQWVLSGPPALNVAGGASARYVAGFPLPGAALPEGAALVVSEAGKMPDSVALHGPVTASPYPMDATIDTRPVLIPADNGCHVTIEPRTAVLDVDAGLDLPGISGNVDGGRRADLGTRFLRVTVRATSDSNPCNGGTILPGTFRLAMDGAVLEPAHYVSRSIRVGEPQDVVLVFVVPEGASAFELRGGSQAAWAVSAGEPAP